MCKLILRIGTLQNPRSKADPEEEFYSLLSPPDHKQPALNFIGSCQSWTRTLALLLKSFGLWAGQMEPLGRELFRATSHCWPNCLKSWTGGWIWGHCSVGLDSPSPKQKTPQTPRNQWGDTWSCPTLTWIWGGKDGHHLTFSCGGSLEKYVCGSRFWASPVWQNQVSLICICRGRKN